MGNRIPPLNSLKVFEAAARHMSFKKAAEELHVTPAAVSHQLSQLESVLGMRLFVRYHHGIELTPAARASLPTLQQGLDHVRNFVEQLRLHPQRETITVRASPSFTMRWLMPRLHRFIISHPGIEVNVDTCAKPFVGQGGMDTRAVSPNGHAEGVDVTLLYGSTKFPGFVTEQLLEVAITPLCSPSLLEHRPALTSPQQLSCFPLLHGDREAAYGNRPLWTIWLEAAGAENIRTDQGRHFTHASLAIEAAMEGLGIVVSNPVLATVEIEAGKLVAPFDLQVPLASGYQMLSSEISCRRSAVAAFRQWLRAEAEKTRAGNSGSLQTCLQS